MQNFGINSKRGDEDEKSFSEPSERLVYTQNDSEIDGDSELTEHRVEAQLQRPTSLAENKLGDEDSRSLDHAPASIHFAASLKKSQATKNADDYGLDFRKERKPPSKFSVYKGQQD